MNVDQAKLVVVGLLSIVLWGLGFWQLAFESLALGAVLTVVGGIGLLVALALKQSDPETAGEGIFKTISDYVGHWL
jgi:hypothetical protein